MQLPQIKNRDFVQSETEARDPGQSITAQGTVEIGLTGGSGFVGTFGQKIPS